MPRSPGHISEVTEAFGSRADGFAATIDERLSQITRTADDAAIRLSSTAQAIEDGMGGAPDRVRNRRDGEDWRGNRRVFGIGGEFRPDLG